MIEDLYKVKIIRDFLSLFSDNKWKYIISLTLEYGILNLRKNHNIASLSLEDLEIINNNIKEEENKKKANRNSPMNNPTPTRSRQTNNLMLIEKSVSSNGRATSEPNKRFKAFKPPSQWRTGDKVLYVKGRHAQFVGNSKEIITDRNSELDRTSRSMRKDIYPKWWGDVSKNLMTEKIQKLKQIDYSEDKETRNNEEGIIHDFDNSIINSVMTNNIEEVRHYKEITPSKQNNQPYNKQYSNSNQNCNINQNYNDNRYENNSEIYQEGNEETYENNYNGNYINNQNYNTNNNTNAINTNSNIKNKTTNQIKKNQFKTSNANNYYYENGNYHIVNENEDNYTPTTNYIKEKENYNGTNTNYTKNKNNVNLPNQQVKKQYNKQQQGNEVYIDERNRLGNIGNTGNIGITSKKTKNNIINNDNHNNHNYVHTNNYTQINTIESSTNDPEENEQFYGYQNNNCRTNENNNYNYNINYTDNNKTNTKVNRNRLNEYVKSKNQAKPRKNSKLAKRRVMIVVL